eukprot:TRINITY_DN1764_c0_g1_i2.p1 TRINITY_DN1764_c0_g1~~TRINITY_DN1764_c0_g1_i2.p1  ORF type:complete len:126 (-),score=33.81 TRINITY_DN1764_c0_g1_i2:59-436(-)
MSVILMKVKMPPYSPVIYKSFRFAGDSTVQEACAMICQSLISVLSFNENLGLYLPSRKEWLNENLTLDQVKGSISAEEFVELKNKEEEPTGFFQGLPAQTTYVLFGAAIGVAITSIIMSFINSSK